MQEVRGSHGAICEVYHGIGARLTTRKQIPAARMQTEPYPHHPMVGKTSLESFDRVITAKHFPVISDGTAGRTSACLSHAFVTEYDL